MHVLTQMVAVMLRTPRWYLEILVIFWLMCRSKPRIPVWQSVKFISILQLLCVASFGFELFLCFINTLTQQQDNECWCCKCQKKGAGRTMIRISPLSVLVAAELHQFAGRRSSSVCLAGGAEDVAVVDALQ